MEPRSPFRILFVCMGNICRSPAAENVMRHLIRERGLESRIECDSAGTISLHTGEPPDARMSQAAGRRGIAMTGRARQVKADDLSAFDLVLAMDSENLRDLKALNGQGAPRAEVRLFCEYCRHHTARQVPDPYYGGEAGFEQVMDLLEDGCAGILEKLFPHILQ